MNAQQARIWALLQEAAHQYAETEVIDTALQMDLAAEGYELSQLDADVEQILSDR